MLSPVSITQDFAVARALAREDFERAAELGFKTIVSLLPDGEKPDALDATQAAQAAAEAGLAFAHIPTASFELFTNETVSAVRRVLTQASGPVLATCSSGQRAAIVWAAASARSSPVASVLDRLAKAGLDLAFLRDDLEAQANWGNWQGTESGGRAAA